MAEKWVTIAPLKETWCLPNNMPLPYKLGEGIFLDHLPKWLTTEESKDSVDLLRPKFLETIDDNHSLCITVEYEADSLGAPDPDWNGLEKRSIQNNAFEKISQALFALWLLRPTSLYFKEVAHIAYDGTEWIFRQIANYDARIPLHEYTANEHQLNDFKLAYPLINALTGLDEGGTLRIATHSTIRALTEQDWALRFLVLWIVLESLFGPEDPRETTYRLSQRLALFLGKNNSEKQDLFSEVKSSYSWRSKLVHGFRLAKLTPEKSQSLILQLESVVRRSIVAILSDSSLISIFNGKNRENFLESLVFK